MPDTLTTRALNRATLARQLLLRRSPLSPLTAIAHLGGMQAQAPLAPYTGLSTRLENFKPEDLSTLISERHVLRAHLYRQTVHLLTAEDYLDFRPLFAHFGVRGVRAYYAKDLADAPIAEVPVLARTLLKGTALTRAELGKLLAQQWPKADPSALAFTATSQLPVVQVPPRGLWGARGQVTVALAEDWLGRAPSVSPPDAVMRLVLRYLGAFGPATVSDIQTWSGLTRLREVTDGLDLRVFRGEDGAVLLDLPDAPRPDPDTPAPPRFLPEYDNLLLSHTDRTRVIPHDRPVPLPPGNGSTQGTLLIDGQWQATWKLTGADLHIHPFIPLPPATREAIAAEATHLPALDS
ncbi:MAG TPA: winged helix DNA-binding domain-containing protein, partial [Streptosporangiaceae bacterium]|nr:winged helix DNA-binding domain-containing protein [Streptosporangiaceae bacterium]